MIWPAMPLKLPVVQVQLVAPPVKVPVAANAPKFVLDMVIVGQPVHVPEIPPKVTVEKLKPLAPPVHEPETAPKVTEEKTKPFAPPVHEPETSPKVTLVKDKEVAPHDHVPDTAPKATEFMLHTGPPVNETGMAPKVTLPVIVSESVPMVIGPFEGLIERGPVTVRALGSFKKPLV